MLYLKNDVEIPVPKYFINERAKNLKEREKLLGQVLAKIGPQDGDKEKEEIRMPWEQAIRIIQIHERARQGRLRAKFMREIRQQEDREKQIQTRGPPTLDPDVAAMRIQKVQTHLKCCYQFCIVYSARFVSKYFLNYFCIFYRIYFQFTHL